MYLEISRNLVLALLLLGILVFIYRFNRKWEEGAYYCTTVLQLKNRHTEKAFTFLFLANFFSTLGTFMVGLGWDLGIIASFNLSIICWALFFKIVDDLIRNREVRWLPGSAF
ncbi:MAG: hypothetical protein ABEK01_04210 [Candidatus Nanohaloarchaea archaeon]